MVYVSVCAVNVFRNHPLFGWVMKVPIGYFRVLLLMLRGLFDIEQTNFTRFKLRCTFIIFSSNKTHPNRARCHTVCAADIARFRLLSWSPHLSIVGMRLFPQVISWNHRG